MCSFWRPALLVIILATTLSVGGSFEALAQEEEHPTAHDILRRGTTEDAKEKADEHLSDDQRREVEHGKEIDRATHSLDFSQHYNTGPLDLKALVAASDPDQAKTPDVKADDIQKNEQGDEARASENLQIQKHSDQAQHAWDRHQNEFRRIGIDNSKELKLYFDEIRADHDYEVDLPRGRRAFGKVEKGTEGTIVVDNPEAQNGGTGFRVENVRERIERLRKSE